MTGRSPPAHTKDIIATSQPKIILSSIRSATEIALSQVERRPTLSSKHPIPMAETRHQRNDSCLSMPVVTTSEKPGQLTLAESVQMPNKPGKDLLRSERLDPSPLLHGKVDDHELAEYDDLSTGIDHSALAHSLDESSDDLSDADSLLEIEQIVRIYSRDRTNKVHMDEEEHRGRARTRRQHRCMQK